MQKGEELTAYEYQIQYHDTGSQVLTVRCRFPLDRESMEHKRIGRSGGVVEAHVIANSIHEALEEFWKLYNSTNKAQIV